MASPFLFYSEMVVEEKGKNIKLVLEYDGNAYHGWQRQKGEISIQGILEDKIGVITGKRAKLIASGRTDSGVHALHQVCNFLTKTNIDPGSLKKGLNALTPPDIFIKEAEYVPLSFHARYSAKSKTYEYRILNRREPNVFLRHYTWHVPQKLHMAKMRECLSALQGRHDFSSFRSTGSGISNPVRTMILAECHLSRNGIIRIVFEADGFLRHMVRNIVGTIVQVGSGKIEVEKFLEILQARDRQKAGPKAPAQGLFLSMVRY